MVNALMTQGRTALAPLGTLIGSLQVWMDGLLVGAEGAPEAGSRGGMPTWAYIVIAVVAIPLCLVLFAVCLIAVLTLLGPSIGNTFSNIQGGI